jgi:hypothetical protein
MEMSQEAFNKLVRNAKDASDSRKLNNQQSIEDVSYENDKLILLVGGWLIACIWFPVIAVILFIVCAIRFSLFTK